MDILQRNRKTVKLLKRLFIAISLSLIVCNNSFASLKTKKPTDFVNVFLGTSGDHGQISPSASYPFGMMSIGPITYPKTHTGYDFYAKEFLGFSHGRMEGVGCVGSGGNILIKPFSDNIYEKLIKVTEEGSPGFYQVGFKNGIKASFVVNNNLGVHQYFFPNGKKNLSIDLSSVLANGFHGEVHKIVGNQIEGSITSGTTCNAGKFKFYYSLKINGKVRWEELGNHKLVAHIESESNLVEVRIGISAVNTAYAKAQINTDSFISLKQATSDYWNQLLGKIEVRGDKERTKLFYSLLYRSLQSPFKISETDGAYRANDGTQQQSEQVYYNGWAIWDNYKTQLPLFSLAFPSFFGDFSRSIASLYKYGKKDYATQHEPSNTVRTEHAVVVILDAINKGYKLPLLDITKPLQDEIDKLDFKSPDKALESCYDIWAFSQILLKIGEKEKSAVYLKKALAYKEYWEKDFQDLSRNDLDAMSARGMYQGTVWQYRWLVPFDIEGLKQLAGGDMAFTNQLDQFFDNDYYNHANEPDIQAPYLYNATQEPWKSQDLIRKIAIDTMVQHYFNDNSRGVGSYIGHIYNNRPRAFLRTMDDDAGAMSSWFVLAGLGISPACIGEPVFYLHLPLFKSMRLKLKQNTYLDIKIKNYNKTDRYISAVIFNGKKLERNWLSYEELMSGGTLQFLSTSTPNKTWGIKNQWISKAGD
ncbi:MAG TPA: glycoside hydrolase domain-containing protein [Pelobium sp.]|nr:glycoside hydrolase domain-containing protein [Pelobium sp.]